MPEAPLVSRDTLYYDGQCGLCRQSVRFFRALDWLGRIEYRDSTRIPAAELPAPLNAALKGIPMRTRDGRVLVGFPAARRALLQTPLGFLSALLLYVPGLSWIGARVYRFVAARRRRGGFSCALEPAHARDGQRSSSSSSS